MRIALFITCLTDTLFPDTGKAVVTLLERLGHQVEFPDSQTCCGQMHFNSGYRRESLPLARGFAASFDGYDAIVSPSASCTAMVREYHGQLADEAGDAGLARAVAEIAPRVYDLSTLLADVLGLTDVGAYFPHRVAYHPTCHSLRMLRVGDAPLRLLREVRGLELAELPDAESCCGFGGTFAVKFDAISTAMAQQKVDNAIAADADYIISTDASCLLHLQGYIDANNLPLKAYHIADVLAMGWGNI